MTRKLRPLFILVLWELWKHHNAIVFDGAAPLVAKLTNRIMDEARRWSQARILKGNLAIFYQALFCGLETSNW